MDDTHFMNSTGLHDPEHYSTARDMAVLLEQGLKNETFREIIESPWHSTPEPIFIRRDDLLQLHV